ncbi:MAG: DNA-protecting protein DprA [Deltaproteobacteria bacterium]|nr:DNA-protecting protein DprA [Deltaproteobacteria bacterium]
MNSNNFKRAVNYATILGLVNYSKKALRSLSQLDELVETEEPGDLFNSLAKLFSTSKHSISRIYNRCLKSFQDYTEDYHIIYRKDPLYPELLEKTDDAPLFLFCEGEIDLFNKKGISVVGTRNPSDLGVRRARKLAMLLAADGYVVVSGLAKGIDTAAHTGAIKAGGRTIAVIGTPLDRSYPKENSALQKVIAQGHLLVSQFPFTHPVTKFNFPARNYTMSGISRATVVIEASESSGALIQARQCMAQGRHLFILRNLLDRDDLKWPGQYREKGAFVISDIEDVPNALKELPSYKLGPDEQTYSMFS